MTLSEEMRAKHPMLFERAVLSLEATECICHLMNELGVSRKALAKHVNWSKKKLSRVLGSDRISMKQLCKLLLAMGYHAKITAEPCGMIKQNSDDSGFHLIDKTLTLIKMLHDDNKNCATGEQVVLAPATYAQVVETLEETKRFRLEVQDVLERAIDHAETHDDYDWIGAADELLKKINPIGAAERQQPHHIASAVDPQLELDDEGREIK
jgi:hypothetical protein